MARASRAVAEQHRIDIERSSSRLFKEYGLHGVTVAQVMADAGLTHGGFYGHFGSKDELAAIACARAFAESGEKWSQRIADSGGDGREARRRLADPYLSPTHRDHVGEGCTAAALTGDIAREPADKPIRAVYAAGVRDMVNAWRSTLPNPDTPEANDTALAQIALLVGTMAIARASRGDPLSEEIIEAARRQLLQP
ncbi:MULTISPECIES: TetR/AcrR family transcriptional regulator [Cupriavidus]|jgi:TetR/AcrR family transcriptional repressor of nem operon|uniref:TetR/AcrR family transcriptional regulator n=1 Tax=Cupriavidus pauculus TaxID=82633 RepID=A0A5P2HBL9_9BURK|nr:TetR/AcrR family transcriptional regulator [Cupriavidus pauculus]QET04639.1 TetR/AcrR family transcriptional regulator [Cupriavidus pauculus]